MKTFILFLFVSFLSVTTIYSNEPFKRQDSDHVKEIFTSWNDDLGGWMYESLAAFVVKEELPERPKTASKTTFQYLSEMSQLRRDRLKDAARIALEEERISRDQTSESYFWEEYIRMIELAECETNTGRSSGDPHMTTFDGERYDFQNAGEYVLTSNTQNRFEIQTRQVRHNSSISVNGAAVIFVNGDTISYYAQNFPDEQLDKPLRINGAVATELVEPIYLAGGAVLSFTENKVTVNAPTGEQVQISTRKFSSNVLLDISVFTPSCVETIGLLGDSNGDSNDDLTVREGNDGGVRTVLDFPVSVGFDDVFGPGRRSPNNRSKQSARLDFISRGFGNQFVVDTETSRFEVPLGILPPEEMYPMEHLTLDQLTDEQIEEGLKLCKQNGIAEEDWMGCVYDYGYVGLEPVKPGAYQAPKKPRNPGQPDPKVNKDKTTPNRTIRRGGFIPPAGTNPNQGTGVRTPSNPGGGTRTPSSAPASPRR